MLAPGEIIAQGLHHESLRTVAVVTLCFLAVSPATAGIMIGFDDVTANVAVIPNGYGGLQWSNMEVVNNTYFPDLAWGAEAGMVSPSSVAFNAYGNPATVSSSTPFLLDSVYLTGLWNDGLNVQIDGYLSGQLVYSAVEVVSATSPTLATMPGYAVDTVVFSSSGGTHHAAYTNGFGTDFVADNLIFTPGPLVPEPPTIAPAVVGIVAATIVVRRRPRYR